MLRFAIQLHNFVDENVCSVAKWVINAFERAKWVSEVHRTWKSVSSLFFSGVFVLVRKHFLKLKVPNSPSSTQVWDSMSCSRSFSRMQPIKSASRKGLPLLLWRQNKNRLMSHSCRRVLFCLGFSVRTILFCWGFVFNVGCYPVRWVLLCSLGATLFFGCYYLLISRRREDRVE